MPISAIDAISPAFQHARQQLMQPFRASQWAKLGLVGLLAGEMSSGGGGCNPGAFQMPTPPNHSQRFLEAGIRRRQPRDLRLADRHTDGDGTGADGFVSLCEQRHAVRSLRQRGGERVPSSGKAGPAGRVRDVVILSGRFCFCSHGSSGLTILIGIPAGFAFVVGWLRAPKEHLIPLILGGMALFFVVMIFVIAQLLVHVMSKDFVVPQMALEGISAIEGWRRLLPQIKAEKGGYAAYIGMKIVMAIGAAVVLGIVSAIVMLLFLIPVGGLGAVAVIAGMAAGLTWNLYTITLAVVAGSIAIFTILYVLSLVSVPAVVFFPAYSIHFFASRYPALGCAVTSDAPAARIITAASGTSTAAACA